MSDNVDRDYETSSDTDASFCCTDCDKEFKSFQELKEHESNRNKFNLKSLNGYVLLLDRQTLSF